MSVREPDSITMVELLEDRLCEPTPGAVEAMARLQGDLIPGNNP